MAHSVRLFAYPDQAKYQVEQHFLATGDAAIRHQAGVKGGRQAGATNP
jgi:hypothetical protein